MITNYKELPVGKWLDILDLAANSEMDPTMQQVGILSILSDKPEDEILNLPLSEYSEMAAASFFLNEEIPVSPRCANTYKVGGFTLIPCLDVRKMIAVQYMDFQEFCKQGYRGIAEVLSCFLVPKGHKYNTDYDILDVQNAIKENLCASDAVCLYAFFFARLQRSIADLLTFSRKMAKGLKDSPAKAKILTEIQAQLNLLRTSGSGLLS